MALAAHGGKAASFSLSEMEQKQEQEEGAPKKLYRAGPSPADNPLQSEGSMCVRGCSLKLPRAVDPFLLALASLSLQQGQK